MLNYQFIGYLYIINIQKFVHGLKLAQFFITKI